MGRITSYDENGKLIADFDKDAYGPHWFHKGEWPKSINQNEGVKLAANLRRLEEENAKLRELVKQMRPRAKAFLQMCVQLGCTDTLSYDWELQMHELGIEVDE